MSEADLQALVERMCLLLKLRYYHTRNSRGSAPGFPDLVIVGSKGVIYRELKTAKGTTTMAQQEWLRDLAAAGCDAGIWRPADLARRIGRELAALR